MDTITKKVKKNRNQYIDRSINSYCNFCSSEYYLACSFIAYIILVALYGSVTSDKMILLKQDGIAILTLISLFF